MERLTSLSRWLIIAVLALVVAGYMTTYKVRFNETAVLTTFGKTSDVIDEPGLRFKVPYVQRETKYDNRARFLESPPETINTSDNRNIVVRSFLIWEVADPKKFYEKYSGRGERAEDHYKGAESDLRGRLRSAVLAEISRYQLGDLLSPGAEGSKLGELEANVLTTLQSSDAASAAFSEFGIRPLNVGITSIKFSEEVTRKVFEAMNAGRAKIANAAISEGTTRADTIRKAADADAEQILDFARVLADKIRVQGQIEAAPYLKQMDEAPELAVFLKNMEFMREAWGKQVTLVLGTSLPGLEIFRADALGRLKAGQIPAFTAPVPDAKKSAAATGATGSEARP